MNYIQYMKPGGHFDSSQWDFNSVDKSKLTPEQIKYAVELYFWRTKDPEMKKQYELWSDYQKRINASLKADSMSDIAAAAELPEVTITMAKPNYIDLIKSDIRNKWANMSTEDKVHAGIDAATTIGGFIPGVDVVADGADVLHSLQRKDWTGAGIGAAAMVLPFVSAPMLRKIKTLSNTLFSPEARLARAMNKNIKQGIQLGKYYHGSPNRNISRFKIGKDGGIYFTQNRNAAKLYTGTFGTGKVYNADLDLGNKTITIDNGGAAWTKIPENTVSKAFNLTPLQVHDIIGSYNLGEVPWHYGFTKMFGYKPKNNYYAIDQVVKLGKGLGISSLIIKNAKDNGKRLFSRTMPYDLTVVYNPRQIILGGQTPNLKLYGILKNFNNGLIRLGYTTSGIKQTGTPTGNFHWREDITDIDNPILLDVKPDMYYTRTHTTPVIKEITNVDDMLLRIGIVPISNIPVLAVEQIAVNPVNRLVKVGERVDLNLSPNRVVQFEYQPRLVDNKGRLASSDADRYFGIPTKTETLYTLWHKSGGSIKIKKKNRGKFTASAKAAGEGVQEHAHKVMNDPNATPLQKKRANFAIQAKKWHRKHQLGGKINYLNYFK